MKYHFRMRTLEIYIMLEIIQPKTFSEIVKAMEIYHTKDHIQRVLNNMIYMKLIKKEMGYKLTDSGRSILNDHIDKVLSKL